MHYNIAWRILFGLGTAVASLPIHAAQTGQPDTSPALTHDGAAQGATNRENSGIPQTSSEPLINEALRSPKPDTGTGTEGIKAGSFLLFPEIGVSATYDTNVFATRTNEVKDWMWSYTPSITARSNWNRHQVRFGLGGNSSVYNSNSSQNTDDYWLDAKGTYEISKATNVYAGAGFSQNHEDRSSPDLRFGTEPTLYTDTNAFAGVFHDFGKVYGRFGIVTSQLDFRDVPTSSGAILNNDDRNRTVTSIGGRISYRTTPLVDLFLQGNTDHRHYETSPDDNGYFRSSNGYRVDVGASFNVADRIVGEAYVGHMHQNYDDARLSDIDTLDFGGHVRWYTSPWNMLRFSIDRIAAETVVPGASSYLDSSVSARVEHDISRDTLATAGVIFGMNEFQGYPRTDRYSEATFGIRHYISRAVRLGADYHYMDRQSDVLEANYHRNLVTVSISSDFGARRRTPYFIYEDRDMSLLDAPGKFGGLYLGGTLGFGNVTTETFGLRDMTPGNTDSGQFAKGDFDYGLFAGLGKAFDHWYLGAEITADQSEAGFSHTHNAIDPTETLNFRVNQKASAPACAPAISCKAGPCSMAESAWPRPLSTTPSRTKTRPSMSTTRRPAPCSVSAPTSPMATTPSSGSTTRMSSTMATTSPSPNPPRAATTNTTPTVAAPSGSASAGVSAQPRPGTRQSTPDTCAAFTPVRASVPKRS